MPKPLRNSTRTRFEEAGTALRTHTPNSAMQSRKKLVGSPWKKEKPTSPAVD